MADETKKQPETDNVAGATPNPEPTAKIQELEKQRDEYLAGWKRAAADFINYKKEDGKRLEEAITFGNIDLIKDLLAVLDSFDLALQALKNDEAGTKGVLMIKSQYESILKKRGLEKIMVKPGDVPDPRLHEAMSEVAFAEGDSKRNEFAGKIVDELVTGYMLGGRVIRPSKVRIGKEY